MIPPHQTQNLSTIGSQLSPAACRCPACRRGSLSCRVLPPRSRVAVTPICSPEHPNRCPVWRLSGQLPGESMGWSGLKPASCVCTRGRLQTTELEPSSSGCYAKGLALLLGSCKQKEETKPPCKHTSLAGNGFSSLPHRSACSQGEILHPELCSPQYLSYCHGFRGIPVIFLCSQTDALKIVENKCFPRYLPVPPISTGSTRPTCSWPVPRPALPMPANITFSWYHQAAGGCGFLSRLLHNGAKENMILVLSGGSAKPP